MSARSPTPRRPPWVRRMTNACLNARAWADVDWKAGAGGARRARAETVSAVAAGSRCDGGARARTTADHAARPVTNTMTTRFRARARALIRGSSGGHARARMHAHRKRCVLANDDLDFLREQVDAVPDVEPDTGSSGTGKRKGRPAYAPPCHSAPAWTARSPSFLRRATGARRPRPAPAPVPTSASGMRTSPQPVRPARCRTHTRRPRTEPPMNYTIACTTTQQYTAMLPARTATRASTCTTHDSTH